MRTTTAWQPSEIPIRNTQCDVVVFGAGMAGLAAARALCASGIETCVLEARRRVGGRAWTVQGTLAGGESTEPLELGAEFVHGRAPETAALAAAAHVELVESAPRVRWWLDRRLVDRPDLDAVVEGAVEAAAATVKDRPDRSLVEALDATRLQEPSRSLARQFVENFEGAAGSNLSARALALGTGLERSRRVEGGYSRLAEGLAASLPNGVLRLGRVVQSVRWRPDGVEVRTVSADGMTPPALVRCRCAIVALPLAVIRRVQFDPPLRRDCGKSVSLARLGTGRATRVVLCFREPFWRERLAAPFFVHAPGESFPVLWTGPHRETRTIVAWAGGPASSALAVRSPGELAEVALASLSRVFGSSSASLRDLLECTAHHDWARDRWARGVYSYPRVGGAGAASLLEQPLGDVLFFAGEATSPPPWNGTVEGALGSGARAARKVAARWGRCASSDQPEA